MKFRYRKDVLPNGTRVVTEASREAGSVSLGFWVGAGASSEPGNLSGVSHFIEHMLFKGTRNRTAYQIAHALESVGGSLDAFAGRETTAFVARCLPEHVGIAVRVVGDMLSNPAMRKKDIELEKRVIAEEIRTFEDAPEDVVHELLARSVWSSNPIGRPVLGTTETVLGFSRGRILPYFRSYYVSPNAIVAASGNVDHGRLLESVSRVLRIPDGRPPEAARAYDSGVPRVFNSKRKVSQCYICMGTEGPAYTEKRKYATMLLSMIVGGGMTSRLFQEVREKEGLAYSVYCSCEFYRETGIFFIFLAVDPARARRAIGRVIKELRLVKSRGLRRGELASVKRQLRSGLVLGLESMSARMTRLAREEAYLGAYCPEAESVGLINRVRDDDVIEEAHALLAARHFSLVAVGPASTDFPSDDDLSF